MIKIDNEEQYKQIMASIEKLLKVATENGGFDFLSEIEREGLNRLGLLAEEYEDNSQKIMPLQV
jgi:antitoxin component HigA of HigAB toxin-antitoxin module